MSLAPFLDFTPVFVFALTGALVASRAQLHLVGFVFVAALTAIGGGTTRDLIGGSPQMAVAGCAAMTFALRAGSSHPGLAPAGLQEQAATERAQVRRRPGSSGKPRRKSCASIAPLPGR
jgi:hypothetical protein